MNPCCTGFEPSFNREPSSQGFQIRRHVKEPPHYDPPRYFVLSVETREEQGLGCRFVFVPFVAAISTPCGMRAFQSNA